LRESTDLIQGGQAGFEIHVYNGAGEEVGIVSGAQDWIGKHGFPDNTPPPGITDDIVNAINVINLEELRANGSLAEGAAFRGGQYLNEGRILGPRLGNALSVIPTLSILTGYWAQQRERAQRSARGEMNVDQHMCDEARIPWAPDHVDTRLGPMPAELMGCPKWPGMSMLDDTMY